MHNITYNVGIWGYGLVGRSIARYMRYRGHEATVFDASIAREYCDMSTGIQFMPEHAIYTHACDYIVPSPGIDINTTASIRSQCVTEYDIYAQASTTPHIGITGSLGKTTITSLLTHTLNVHGISACYGGNIATAMCDLLDDVRNVDYHVLELSSFQLEHITHAAPDIAVLTNIHPNHLNRHGTHDAYTAAKCNIFRYQRDNQHAIIPISMRHYLSQIYPYRACCPVAESYHAYVTYAHMLHAQDAVYYIHEQHIYKAHNHTTTCVTHIPDTVTFAYNWLIVAAVCDICGISHPCTDTHTIEHTPHRREYIGTYAGVAWYNDSKATIMAATYAAVQSLSDYSIILILGGQSKGVSREPYMKALAQRVSHITCFGQEADHIYTTCQTYHIPASQCTTVRDAVRDAASRAQPGTIVIFSPGGASFDQFTSYHKRGREFTYQASMLQYRK